MILKLADSGKTLISAKPKAFLDLYRDMVSTEEPRVYTTGMGGTKFTLHEYEGGPALSREQILEHLDD